MPREFKTVHSVAQRSNMGDLPSLIQDVRETKPVLSTTGGKVYVKGAAYVYTPSHLLIVPDRFDKKDAPGVTDISTDLLFDTFRVASRVATVVARQTDAEFIDLGWNYSPGERKKRIASQPDNLHVHVVGYEPNDLQTVDATQVQRDPILSSKLKERMDSVSKDLLVGQVIPNTPDFDDFFIESLKDPLAFYLKDAASFENPDFAAMMQKLHQNGQRTYNQVAQVFFDLDNPQMDYYVRPMPRTSFNRHAQLTAYLAKKPYISNESAGLLRNLADRVVPFDELVRQKFGVNPTDNDAKNLLYSQGALNGFAYAMTFSADINPDRSVDQWKLKISPKVFSSQDLLQGSAQFKLFERNENEALSEAQFDRLTKIEQLVRKGI